MKKLLLAFIALLLISCLRDIKEDVQYPIEQSIKIEAESGLKFERPSITDASLFNFKVVAAGNYSIVIRDHFKNVISKSDIVAKTGDNVLRFYTNAIPDGDYFVEFVDSNNEIVESDRLTIL